MKLDRETLATFLATQMERRRFCVYFVVLSVASYYEANAEELVVQGVSRSWHDAKTHCADAGGSLMGVAGGLMSDEIHDDGGDASLSTVLSGVADEEFVWINAKDYCENCKAAESNGTTEQCACLRFSATPSSTNHHSLCRKGSPVIARFNSVPWSRAIVDCSLSFSRLYHVTTAGEAEIPLKMPPNRIYWLDLPAPNTLLPDFPDTGHSTLRCVGIQKKTDTSFQFMVDECGASHKSLCDTSGTQFSPVTYRLGKQAPTFTPPPPPSSTSYRIHVTPTTRVTSTRGSVTGIYGDIDDVGVGGPAQPEAGSAEEEEEASNGGVVAGVVVAGLVVVGVVVVTVYVVKKKRQHVKYMLKRSRYTNRNTRSGSTPSRLTIRHLMDDPESDTDNISHVTGKTGVAAKSRDTTDQTADGTQEYEECGRAGYDKLKANLAKAIGARPQPGYDGWRDPAPDTNQKGLSSQPRDSNLEQPEYESYDPDSTHLEQAPNAPIPGKKVNRKESTRYVKNPSFRTSKQRVRQPNPSEILKDIKLTAKDNMNNLNDLDAYETPQSTVARQNPPPLEIAVDMSALNILGAYENNEGGPYIPPETLATNRRRDTVFDNPDYFDAYEKIEDTMVNEQSSLGSKKSSHKQLQDLDQYENYGSVRSDKKGRQLVVGKPAKQAKQLADLDSYENL